jgi:putative membrane-bound dehydrogenase-like protein
MLVRTLLREVLSGRGFAAVSAFLLTPAALGLDTQAVLSTIQLHPEFQIELVASEPAVFSPVDIEFDEQGRMYVMEMPGYPFPEKDPGKVVQLSDKDGDGVYETRTVFATDFPVAVSILPYEGGLLVASPPDIVFVKDTNEDGVADVRKVLLTGFDVENTQHNFNGLTYGLDNWIYGVCGGNAGQPFFPDKPEEKFPLRYQDFRIDLHKKIFERIGRSSGGFGLTQDDYGHLFETHNTDHISNLVFPGRYLEGLPVGRRGSLANISDHEEGGLARIYAIGEQDTRVNHPEQSGYVSGGCGITHYGGGKFPAAFNGNMFVCDVVLNLVHQDVISPDGAGFKASRGIEKAEFLASSDRAFRPTNMGVGPDGALYLCDMHRVVIEHPEWIPDELEKNMDLNAGKDQGRIFRITPKGGLPRAIPKFDRGDINSVVAKLGNSNQWYRNNAQRLLVEWQDKSAEKPLKKMLESDNPLARVHALWTLRGLNALTPKEIIKATDDKTPGVRENALILAEGQLGDAKVLDAVIQRAGDSDARVRMYAALVLSRVDEKTIGKKAEAVQAAVFKIAAQGVSDQWSRLAVLSASTHRAAAMLTAVLQDSKLLGQDGGEEMVKELSNVVGRQNDTAQVGEVISAATDQAALDRSVMVSVLDGVAEGLESNGQTTSPDALGEAAERLNVLLGTDSADLQRATYRLCRALKMTQTERMTEVIESAAKRAMDENLPTAERMGALGLLRYTDFAKSGETLFALLDTRQPKEIQALAIEQLRGASDPSIGPKLIEMWAELGPDVRSQASNILLYKQQYHDILLTALETKRLPIGQFNFDLERRRRLLWDDNENTAKRAEKLFSDAGVVTRKAVLDKMRPALSLKGDVPRGHAVYQEICMKCHYIGSEGTDVGPNLTEIFRKSAETLFEDILDPNAAVDTKFISYSVESKGKDELLGGETINGLLVNEDDVSVTIREAGGKDHTYQKKDVAKMTSTGLSTMPEGLEEGMTPQKLADLLAYLQEPK